MKKHIIYKPWYHNTINFEFFIISYSMNDNSSSKESLLIAKAEAELNDANVLLESFAAEWNQTTEHPLDDLDNLRILQYLLQYRLDTQNALSQLNKLQQYLLQLLGIEKIHSLDLNIERLSFALGSDDLHQILSILNQLVDSLLRVLAHILQQQSLDRKKALKHAKKLKQIDILVKVSEKTHSFVVDLEQLKLTLEDVAGAPHPGLILDHIAALEGPISRFQQALQHGLIVSAGLYHQLQNKPHLDSQLADTLQKTNQLIANLQYQPQQQRLFSTPIENTNMARLEERAAAKRLGNFFKGF